MNIRLADPHLCLLVMIGVRADGRKELAALADGYRESAESWADLLRDCARRGMRAPVLAVGDVALGFGAALREVFPETREARCWFHKIANTRPGTGFTCGPRTRSSRLSGRSGTGVAVGTALAGGPPHRSQRALLAHWAPTLGTGVEPDVRPGMRDAGGREPPCFEPAHPLPGHPVALAAAP